MNKINKVAIIGAPGSGKTTLSKELETIYGLPVFNIDTIYCSPNWVLNDPKVRDAKIKEEASKEKWIIDGTFIDTLEYRVSRADKVIFLDYSTSAFLKGIFKRYLLNLGKEKKDMPGCKEKIDFSFIKYVATYNRERRKYIIEILERYKEKDIMYFKNRKELRNWLNEISKDKERIRK